MNCLGIDYGEKRVGLSYGDELGVAVPLPAVTTSHKVSCFAALSKIIKDRQITDIVIGYPYNMDGSAGFKAHEVDAFISELEEHFGLPVYRVDERLTSYQAEDELHELGAKPKMDKQVRESGEIDSRAAVLILQDFLDQQKGNSK